MARRTATAAAGDNLAMQRLRVWLRLLKVSKLVSSELRDRLRDNHNTTLPRFDVMAALYRHEKGLRMSDLSGLLMVSNGNVTGIVSRLAREGCLVRIPVKNDRRATVVRLTHKGREQFASMAARHEGWVDQLFASLNPDETNELTRLLERVGEALDKRREGKQ